MGSFSMLYATKLRIYESFNVFDRFFNRVSITEWLRRSSADSGDLGGMASPPWGRALRQPGSRNRTGVRTTGCALGSCAECVHAVRGLIASFLEFPQRPAIIFDKPPGYSCIEPARDVVAASPESRRTTAFSGSRIGLRKADLAGALGSDGGEWQGDPGEKRAVCSVDSRSANEDESSVLEKWNPHAD